MFPEVETKKNTQRYLTREPGVKPGVLPRVTPIIWSAQRDASAPVSEELLQSFENDGFMLIREMFDTEEISKLKTASRELLNEFDDRNSLFYKVTDQSKFVTEPGTNVIVFNGLN